MDLNDPATWDTPLFPVSVAAAASLVDAATLRIWLVRKDVELHEVDAEAEGAGLARKLSLRSVLTLAATAALARSHVPVRAAFEAAKEWTWIAHANPSDPPRLPAGLYAAPAWTFLIYAPGSPTLITAVAEHAGCIPFNFGDLFSAGYPVRHSPTIVFLNSVDKYARGVCEGFLRS